MAITMAFRLIVEGCVLLLLAFGEFEREVYKHMNALLSQTTTPL